MKPGSTCDIYTEPLINKLRGKGGGVAPDWLPMPPKIMQIIHISNHIFCANKFLSGGLPLF